MTLPILSPERLCALARAEAAPSATDYEMEALAGWVRDNQPKNTDIHGLIEGLDNSNSGAVKCAAEIAYKHIESEAA